MVSAPLRENFMLPVPEASLPAVEICSDRSAAGIDVLRVLDVEVREEHDLEPVAHGRVVVHDVGDGVDELDDQLGHEVAGRGLGAEDERARRHVRLRIALEPQVEREDVEHVQVLPLVFVQALDLDVEERLRIHLHAGALLDERGEAALGGELHLAPLLLELRVVRQRLQLAELVEVAQPAVADAAR